MNDRPHDIRVDVAKRAIRDVHSDTSVSLEETLDSLGYLHDELDILIEAVEQDIRNKREEQEE